MLKCFGVECKEHRIPANGQNQRDYDAAWKNLVQYLDREFRKLGRSPRRKISNS